MNINKDTQIFASFSTKPGNNGCKFFNAGFSYYGINAIYKSFKIDNIDGAIQSSKVFGFSGFSVSQPFKTQILHYVDEILEDTKQIGAANTIILSNNKLVAYNTDYIAAQHKLNSFKDKKIYILGNGGYSKAVQYACGSLNIDYVIINRTNWSNIKYIENSVIYNCTPVENIVVKPNNYFIDGVPTTPTGIELALLQASEQFYIYTGKKFSIKL